MYLFVTEEPKNLCGQRFEMSCPPVRSNPHVSLVMTDGIVHEIFAHFSKQGDIMRGKAVELYHSILDDPSIQLISYHQGLRKLGIELYASNSHFENKRR